MKFPSKLIHGGQCTSAIDLSSYLCTLEEKETLRNTPGTLHNTPKTLRNTSKSLRNTPKAKRDKPKTLRNITGTLRNITGTLRNTPKTLRNIPVTHCAMLDTYRSAVRVLQSIMLVY